MTTLTHLSIKPTKSGLYNVVLFDRFEDDPISEQIMYFDGNDWSSYFYDETEVVFACKKLL